MPSGKADGLGGPARVEFNDEFDEIVHGALHAGELARIDYDIDRLVSCRGRTGGRDGWGITGFVVVQDEVVDTFAVTEIRDGETEAVDVDVVVPAADVMEIYFQIVDVFGCTAFDSDFGKNYHFAIDSAEPTARGRIDFGVDGPPEVSGELGTSPVVVRYQPGRLDDCSTTQGGFAQWGITGFVRLGSGAVRAFGATEAVAGELFAVDAIVEVDDVSELEMWFEATNVFGCHHRDPKVGSYRFDR
ncbi:MAG: hypothetical protein KJO07_22970 [Deltaproteobacteria bacterium]|nr:hypothetical protein [Deltaproteobacteria bacterium]